MSKIIDLHIHTINSDGLFSPKEVIDMAKENNVSVMAITDHDTIASYNDELFNYAAYNNITLIPGVEISTRTNRCGIHVLGYNIDLTNEVLKNKLYEIRNARHIYLHDVSKKLRELGYIINEDDLDKIDSVTKSHISLDIVNNKDNEKLLLKVFNHIPSKGEFIETIMNEGCPAYVKKTTITPEEAVELIKQANGHPVLAHPVAYNHEDGLTDEDIKNLVKNMKVDAIEAYYVYVNKDNRKVDETSHWIQFAKDNNLKYTIGSDFHNKNKIRPVIGLINDLNLSDKEVEKIINLINNK